jgi:hypothetical protein
LSALKYSRTSVVVPLDHRRIVAVFLNITDAYSHSEKTTRQLICYPGPIIRRRVKSTSGPQGAARCGFPVLFVISGIHDVQVGLYRLLKRRSRACVFEPPGDWNCD